ncbi:MAG: sugar transferase [Actinomycetia bacterium]|nr:sugar transferase [Actinomycetes bacterium]
MTGGARTTETAGQTTVADDDRPGGRHLSVVGSQSFYQRRGKRALDLSVGVLLLAASLPLMAVVALCIRLVMGRGVVYRQERVGRNGQKFTMLKFRSMDPDRRQRPKAFDGSDRRRTHKTVNDPRHTVLGRFLRKSSLDEMPQLWNVIRGDMSLVGPRPELSSVVERHNLWNHPRHTVRPGITGVWQISPLRDELLYETVDIDLEYLPNITLRNDVSLLGRTATSVLGRAGK